MKTDSKNNSLLTGTKTNHNTQTACFHHWLARIKSFNQYLGIVILIWASDVTSALSQPPRPDRKVFSNSIVPLPPQHEPNKMGINVQALLPNKQSKLEIQISLGMRNVSEMQQRVAKGEIITETDLDKLYRPPAPDYEALVTWLKEQGFEITQTTADRTSVYARGTLEQIENSLQVKMVKVTVAGVSYAAAKTPPSLPANIAGHVLGINGLQPFLRAHKHVIAVNPRDAEMVPKDPKFLPDIAKLEVEDAKLTPDDAKPAPNVANKPPYLVKEILGAYGGANLPVTGKGQTIAILIDTVPKDSDLLEFWKRNNLPVTIANIEKINVGGGKLPTPEGEETLDVEWTTGIAPGAKVRIYASGSLNFVDLDKALDRIIADLSTQPSMRQVSISLGLGETFMPSDEVTAEGQKFLTLASRGVNVFVSSGDAGSNPDETGHSSSGPLQVEYESSDPFVIGVGGTTLNLDSNGKLQSETGWPGAGGGSSQLFKRPTWQVGPGIPPGDKRLVPDVSLAADPDTGAFLFFQGDVQQIGGTSWSAPAWAGITALINEARAVDAKPPLAFLPPLIYPLMGKAPFRDITQGSNGKFSAGPGFDMVTGIGVPNIQALIDALKQ